MLRRVVREMIERSEARFGQYEDEPAYTRYLIKCFSTWFNVTPKVWALHYGIDNLLQYDLVLVPRTEDVAVHCRFPLMVVEIKYRLYSNKYSTLTDAYFQAHDYRETMIVDDRFKKTPFYRRRPDALFVCSDLVTKERRRTEEFAWATRAFGRRGVYAMVVDETNMVCFTDHGEIFNLMDPNPKLATDHTARTFAGGVPEWTTIKCLFSTDGRLKETSDAVLEQAKQHIPPELPEEFLKP